MEIKTICVRCKKEIVAPVNIYNGTVVQQIFPCEDCLENARAEVRVEKSKEMIAFCESLKKENQV